MDSLFVCCYSDRIYNHLEMKMANLQDEIDSLIKNRALPNSEYISIERFVNNYACSDAFVDGLLSVPIFPIHNALQACYHATAAIWATLRAVGDLLILKPQDSMAAFQDAGAYITLTVALLVMAPIHALTYSLELLTRTVSSWFTGQESLQTLSQVGFIGSLSKQYEGHGECLPSADYFKGSRFFSPYNKGQDVLKQAAAPIGAFVGTGFRSLTCALDAVVNALECIINVAICKPRHAAENISNVGINLSLAVSLALMAPINALVEGIAFVSRLGTTWVNACVGEGEQVSASPSAA